MPDPVFRPTASMQRVFRHPRYAIYAAKTADGPLELHTVLLGASLKDVHAFRDELLGYGSYQAVKFRKFPATGEISKTFEG